MTASLASFDVLIVGGGHAGSQAAIALRQRGFEGSIAVVGEERELPYERPPLSKEYLAGDKTFERILIRPPDYWDERHVTMLRGNRVIAVDPASKGVTLGDGSSLSYSSLIWAAGGRARRLTCDGSDLRQLHTIRNRADVDVLRGELGKANQIVVLGGGYIGLEAAAVLTKLGKKVVLLEALDRVLARVAGEPISRFFEAEHRSRGVDLRTGAAVACIEGRDGSAIGVRLADGEVLPADLVIAGIGIEPEVEPLRIAGAAGLNGVDVDEHCRTSLVDIYAIGDCAAHRSQFAGGATVRIESVQNATDQAAIAARSIVGDPEPYLAVPWFWSNQYDIRLQTIGLSLGYDLCVVRGTEASRSFSVIYLRDERVIALDCVNSAKDFVQGRKLVAEGAVIDTARLRDNSVSLKQLSV